MGRILITICSLGFLPLSLLYGQSNTDTSKLAGPDLSEEMIQNMEMQAEASSTEDADYSAVIEKKAYYLHHPIRLNRASREELEESGLLSDNQVNNLLSYESKHGELISIYELQAVPSFELNEIRALSGRLIIHSGPDSDKEPLLAQVRSGKQELTARSGRVLEPQKGYVVPVLKSSSHYEGNPWKFLLAYQFISTNISWRICGQKDAGEAFFKGSQKRGFDFYSGHLVVRDKGILKIFVAGDFAVGFGQGLIAWSGISFSKTADASLIRKIATGIKPYSSTNENNFLRGAASTVHLGFLEASLFISRKKLDASVTDTTISGKILQVRTLQTSGLHATRAQLISKHSLGQTVAGSNLKFSRRLFSLGFSLVGTQFDAALVPRQELYNRFDFKGRELSNASLDYHWIFRNLNLFGEFAKSSDFLQPFRPGGWAVLQGLILVPDQAISLSMLYRNYGRSYHSFYSNAFSEGSKVSNEQGLYMGLLLKPCQTFTLSCFYDFFLFPWLRYRVNAPSSGNDFFSKLSFNPNKKLELYIHFRKRTKESDPVSSGEEINFPVAGSQTNFRIHISYSLRPGFQIRSRLDLIRANDSLQVLQSGSMISQDLIFQTNKGPFSFTLRYAMFDTPGGSTRIYSYEHTAPGSFSIPSFSARGSRVNCLIRYRSNPRLELWLNIGRTFYDSKNTISAGTPDEIASHHKTEGMIQVKYKLIGNPG